jgi:hypothetical protein
LGILPGDEKRAHGGLRIDRDQPRVAIAAIGEVLVEEGFGFLSRGRVRSCREPMGCKLADEWA